MSLWITGGEVGLEEMLERYDRVFLFMGTDKIYRDFTARFCASEALACSEMKILILATEGLADGKAHVCRRLIWEEALRLKRFYLMYEFSDRFKFFSREDVFGSIVNYVETGVLTWEEVFSAILH